MQQLSGRVALVTGAAGGLGAAIGVTLINAVVRVPVQIAEHRL